MEWSVNGVLTASDCSILNWSAVSKLIAASLLDYMLSSVLFLFFFLTFINNDKKDFDTPYKASRIRARNLRLCRDLLALFE